MTFDRSTIEPTPVPDSIVVVVTPEPSGARPRRSDAERIQDEIERHVNYVRWCEIEYQLYACAVCNGELNTAVEALEHCAADCPTCNGLGYNESRMEPDEQHPYARIERGTCPDCYLGRVPDIEQWASYHPATGVKTP